MEYMENNQLEVQIEATWTLEMGYTIIGITPLIQSIIH